MGKRVFWVHPVADNVEALENSLQLSVEDKKKYSLEWDPYNPEILFVSEVILYDLNVMETFKRLYSKAGLCVFFPGECIAPDLNIFDYAISFSGFDQKNDRIFRMPVRLFFSEYLTNERDYPIKSFSEAYSLLKRKTGFCNFIYSNPNGHPNRKRLFDVLSGYKCVDSYGAYLNNMGLEKSGGSDFTKLIRNSTEIKRGYKFTIASENATFPGYTSEKLFTSLEAGTIPIYWGNPEVALDANPEAFINCHDYKSFDEVLERVKEIDSDDDLWCDIVSQPWLTDAQLKREMEELERYHAFLDIIFLAEKPVERKRPEGTWPDVYQNFWLGKKSGSDKYRTYFNICSSFCKLMQSGKHIYDALDKSITSVVIYGMGDIGKILLKDFRRSKDIKVPYCIDNRMTPQDVSVECVRLSELQNKEKPDAVVITVPGDYEAIRNSVLKVFDTKIISVMELFG